MKIRYATNRPRVIRKSTVPIILALLCKDKQAHFSDEDAILPEMAPQNWVVAPCFQLVEPK